MTIELRADVHHAPWWEYVDVVALAILVDEQRRSAFELCMAVLRERPLRRAPGSYESAAA